MIDWLHQSVIGPTRSEHSIKSLVIRLRVTYPKDGSPRKAGAASHMSHRYQNNIYKGWGEVYLFSTIYHRLNHRPLFILLEVNFIRDSCSHSTHTVISNISPPRH